MPDHYQQPQPHLHPPASPAHGPYHPYPPREPSTLKRELPEDLHRPNSTGHAPDAHPPPSHHTLPPPPNYPDSQPRHISYDNGHSLPPTPGGYRGPSYPAPPPTPISQQPSYEPQGSYASEPMYSVSYSSSMPSKKKNTRASQVRTNARKRSPSRGATTNDKLVRRAISAANSRQSATRRSHAKLVGTRD